MIKIAYIDSPAGLIAIVVRENGSDTYHYVYSDHLGSILTLTDASGNVEVEQNFDAWGRRRNPTDWSYVGVPARPDWLYRGYTGHEHLDPFVLINMNGRLYDPVVGRVLSPDNFVQDPFSTQNFNRYSYVLNNPLRYTDPDGNFIFIIPHISFGSGGFSLGIEIGIGIPGLASASVTGGFNFGSGTPYWSVQGTLGPLQAGYGSNGAFMGFGYQYAGLNVGVGYGSSGWNAGLSYGASFGDVKSSVGIGWSQEGGFNWNVYGGYFHQFVPPVRDKIAEYALKEAPAKALQQRDGYDCLICATEYIEQLPGGQGRSYEEMVSQFGDSYNPTQGTDTQGGLEKAYGQGNVSASGVGNPNTIGRSMLKGNPTIIAQNRNHALVLTKIELWGKQSWVKYLKGTYAPKTYFNIRVMNPAIGSFQDFFRYHFREPTFTIKLNP